MWTNRREALQALSIAQGCYVPAEIDESSARGDPKPQRSTEDNFIEGDDTYENVDPDCGLISQMLKSIDDCKEEEKIEHEKDVISNLNPLCEEFVPRSEPCSVETQIKRSKPVRPRFQNVAMSSILSNLPSFSDNDKNGTVDIKSCGDNLALNPHDKLKKKENDGKVEKVEKETVDVKSYGDNNFSINPNSMFRRKTVKPSENNNICNNASKVGSKSVKSPVINNYKASPLASNYYKKFMERQEKKKQEEIMREDIWTKLERQMKEIDRDRKRKLIASASSPSNSEDSEISIRNIEDSEGTVANTEDPEGTAIKTEDPKGTAIKTEDPEGTAIKTEDPEGTAIKTEDPEGTAIKTEDPEGTIINWRNSEESVNHRKDEIEHNENWRDSQASPSNSTETDCSPMEKVTLSQHRHLISDACIVCEIICDKHKMIKKH